MNKFVIHLFRKHETGRNDGIKGFIHDGGVLRHLFGFGFGINPVVEGMAEQFDTEPVERRHLHAVLRIELHVITGRLQGNARHRRVIGRHEVQRLLHGIDGERVAGILQCTGHRCLLRFLLPFPVKNLSLLIAGYDRQRCQQQQSNVSLHNN